MHAFRFGVEMIRPFAERTWAESARELEDLGYSTLFVPDHLHQGFGPVVAMATAAAATSTLHVAPAVLAADFRHPAIVARELASLDVLSEGRLEVGLGAGYQVDDYERSGIPMDAPALRVGRLIEHVRVLRGLFGPTPVTFEGEHYRIRELDGLPKPTRPGGPPILVAGGGRRLLTFAAREADIVGVNVALPTSATGPERGGAFAASIDEKFAWIRHAAGERFESIEFHAWIGRAVVTDDVLGVAEQLAVALHGTIDDVLTSPLLLIGTVDEIVERLVERRDRWGYSYVTVTQGAAHALAPVVARLAGS